MKYFSDARILYTKNIFKEKLNIQFHMTSNT